MQITLTDIGKRYNKEWIFRHINFSFSSNNKYAITGANGSGKSTLLQLIAGAILSSEGNIAYSNSTNEDCYKHISIAAPYLELIEEYTANEFLNFHQSFKPLCCSVVDALKMVQLESAANKQIRYFSSGMKQRLKLAQAFLSASSVLLIDEPTTNLDDEGIELYYHLIKNYTQNKTVIISSNDKHEYGFCNDIITIANYKQT